MSEVGWLVIGIAAVVVASAGGWHASRRRRDLVLTTAHLELATVDALTGQQFARFCAALLRVLGYRKVRRARGRGGDAADLVAVAPDDTLVAIRCMRQRDPVDAAAVGALRAAVTTGRTYGRAAILVTTALVTPDARALAAAEGSPVTVADRAVLRHWMEQARGKVADAPRGQSGVRRDTRVLAGIAGCAGLAVLAVVVQAAVSGPGGPASGGSAGAALSGPGGAALSGPGGAARSGATGTALSGFGGSARGRAAASSPSAGSPSASGQAASAPSAPAPPATGHPASRPATPGPRPATSGPSSAAMAPRQVIRAFYAAISRQDWPAVWRLGGRNLGYGPYATYQGMVAGYAGTIRDEVTDLRVRGNVVTGHFRAYHARGEVRAYRFSYVVDGGAIVSGRQDLVSG